MNDWLVARVDTVELDCVQRERVIAWVSEVSGLADDVVRNEISARAVISQDERDRTYRLHLSRFVRPKGRVVLDLAADHPWTEPLVFPLDQLPEFTLTVRDGVPHVAQIGDA